MILMHGALAPLTVYGAGMAAGAARAAVTSGWRLDGVVGAAMAVDGVEEAATVGSSMIPRGATERHCRHCHELRRSLGVRRPAGSPPPPPPLPAAALGSPAAFALADPG